jgi:hypothetical protein
MSKWNGKRFSVYESEEKSALGLIKELGGQTNYNTDELEKVKESNNKKVSHDEMNRIYKIDKDANFTGSWHGIKKPTASQEGLQATVDKINEEDIPKINEQLDNKASVITFFECSPIPSIDGTGELNADTIKYEDIIKLYDKLVEKNYGYVSRRLLGKDSSGTYDIYAYDFTASNPLDTIVIDANIHGGNTSNGGDPKDCAIAIYYCMKKICEEWKNDKILCTLRKEYNISVIPVANPWGFDNNSRYNSNGVDCNRNFSWNWRAENSTFGTAPFSEKESQYIRDNLIDRQNSLKNKGCRVKCYIPFHNYGDNNITPQFPFSVASTSPMVSAFKKVSYFLCTKYGYQFKEGTVTNPKASSADNYAERILGIPTGTPEFPIFRNDGHFRDSFAITQQVEYYLNLIYFGAISNSKTKISVFTPSEKFIVPKGTREVIKTLSDNYTENVFKFDTETGEIEIPSGVEYIRIKGSLEFQYDTPIESKIAVVVTIQKNEDSNYTGYPVAELITSLGGSESIFKYATLKIDSPVISVAEGDKFKINIGANNYSNANLNLLANKYNYIMFEEVNRYKY